MAQGKLSPRQRMINMMYLVLTALLALNVSKEIINAFVTVNESIETSNSNTTQKNARTYTDFDHAMKNDPKKTEPYFKSAMKIKALSDSMVSYIEGIKTELVRQTDGIDPDEATPLLRDVEKKDEYDEPTYIMCGDKSDGKGKRATELKDKIIAYKDQVVKSLDKDDAAKFKARFDVLLNTNDPDKPIDGKRTWEMANFYHNPVVASVTLLSKFQADIKNGESEVITHLYNSISASDYKFDALQGRVIAPTSYVLLGQEYQADVFLAAYSSTANPTIIVGDVDTTKKTLRGEGKPVPVSGGLGKYTDRPGSEGIKKWGGLIKVKNPLTNLEDVYPFTAEYVAAKPAVVVSPDKMNVLYIGVDNPLSISVPGVPNDKVRPSISGGGAAPLKLTAPGKYIARVTTQGEATINVAAEISGKPTPMPPFKFRVKRVPDPVAMVAGKKGGPIQKSILAAQSSVNSIMEGFDFELYFKVNSFKMTRVGKGRDPVELTSESNLITSQMKDVITQCRAGDKIYFEYIKATGPDTRQLAPVNFVIQ